MDSVVLLVFEKRRKAGFLAFANVFNFFFGWDYLSYLLAIDSYR